jgi:Tol biopolymer transport system component
MELWVSNVDGSGATQLTTMRAEAGSPAWSPDGSEIAFDCRYQGNMDVYAIDADGNNLRRITADPAADNTPSWSRDGRWIYFASTRTGRTETWKVSSLGREPVQVTRTGGFLAAESFDGTALFYAKSGDYPTTLWTLSFANGREEQIIDSLRYWSYFAVFPDGIYYIPDRTTSDRFTSFRLNFYDLSSKTFRTVAEVSMWAGLGFALSPDRRFVLFAPSLLGGADLMLLENFK